MDDNIIRLPNDYTQQPSHTEEPENDDLFTTLTKYEDELIKARELAAIVKAIGEQAFKLDTAAAAGRDAEQERFILLNLISVAEPIADAIIKAEL